MFVEPVIGAGGVYPPLPGYLEGLAALCERTGVLLVIDSVICGFGRLGTWFGIERWGVKPDDDHVRQGRHERLPAARRGDRLRARCRAVLASAGRPRAPARADLRRPRDLLRGRAGQHRPARRGRTARAGPRARAAPAGCAERRSPIIPPWPRSAAASDSLAAVELTDEAIEQRPDAVTRVVMAAREAGRARAAAGHRGRRVAAADRRDRALRADSGRHQAWSRRVRRSPRCGIDPQRLEVPIAADANLLLLADRPELARPLMGEFVLLGDVLAEIVEGGARRREPGSRSLARR